MVLAFLYPEEGRQPKVAKIKNPEIHAVESYETSLDHVLAELKRIELKLQLKVKSVRSKNSQNKADSLRGLFVSEEEIESILNDPGRDALTGSSQPDGKDDGQGLSIDFLRNFEESLILRKEEALNRGLTLRLERIKNIFSLSSFEVDVILICLLSEIDLKYQRIYGYIQDDITRKNPTVDLVLQLLFNSFKDRLKAQEAFLSGSSLLKYSLIRLSDDNIARPTPLLAKFIQMDQRIASYLLEGNQPDSRLLNLSSLTVPGISWQNISLPDDIKSRLQNLIARFKNKSPVINLRGNYTDSKQEVAGAICTDLGLPLFNIRVSNLIASETPPDLLVPLIFREGNLQNAVMYFSEFNLLSDSDKSTRLLYRRLLMDLAEYPQWIILDGNEECQPEEISGDKPWISIDFPAASYSERRQIWDRLLKSNGDLVDGINLADLAGKFRFSADQISDVIATARNLAAWRDPENRSISGEDLYAACRKHSRQTLNTLARKIQPMYRWDDIILPKDHVEQLHEICGYVENYHTVYSSWGFGRKISLGKGLNVLFAGPSGTGKTMAAEIVANELKIDLYKIDLSSIVSKYIGETEKNLDRVFREGQTSNAILFFDEADALFGKRSEVRDSHDRYANIETAYLLQKMDEYEGIVILATNLRKNMDEAFSRRMHYFLEFAVPEEPDRLRIWQNVFPKEAPLSENADLNFMARQFKITGGNIKNIALNAAFLASQDGKLITIEHLIRATKREYQKIGKLCTDGDFAQYFELIKS